VTGNTVTITLTTDGLTLNGVSLAAGTYTITTDAATIAGSGATISPSFSGAVSITATLGNVELGAASGDITVGGAAVSMTHGATLTGYSGTLSISPAGSGADTVTLDGSTAQVLSVSAAPNSSSADQSTPTSFQIDVHTSFPDTYNLTAVAPPGWVVTIDPAGLVTVIPAPGSPTGTKPIQIIAKSATNTNLVAQTTVDISVTAVAPGVDLEITPDSQLTVPLSGAQLPSGYQAGIHNLGPTTDTFQLSFENVPAGFTILGTAASIDVAAGQTGLLGVYLQPTSGQLPPPGTQVSFTVKATSLSNPLITESQVVTFTVPEIDAIVVTANPSSVNTAPGVGVTTVITVTNVGNVAQSNITFTITTSAGLVVSGLTPVTLNEGQSTTQTITVTPAANTPLNSALSATIVASFGAVGAEQTQNLILAVNVVVPGADSLANAARVATQFGKQDLANRVTDLSVAMTNLVQTPTNTIYKSQVLAAIDAIIPLLNNDPYLRERVFFLQNERLSIVNSTTQFEYQIRAGNLGGILGPIANILRDEAAHGFSIVLAPNSKIIQPQTPTDFEIKLQNIGTDTTTYDFSIQSLPAGVTFAFDHLSATLLAGAITGQGGQPAVHVRLTSTSSTDLLPFSFTIVATAEEATEITQSVAGTLTARSELVRVASVSTTPGFTQPGGKVAVQAKILNAVNQLQQAKVYYTVTDASNTVLFTSTPVSTTLNVLTTLATVNLGTLDTTGFALGAVTINVFVTDTANVPIPGATGSGSLLIGTPVSATLTTTPPIVAAGDSTVTTTLDLRDQGTTLASSAPVTVPGTSDPYLAGMPNGSTASSSDVAPAQSPVLVTGLSIVPGSHLSFTAVGAVGQDPATPNYGPDGNLNEVLPHVVGAENGISSIRAPFNALVGVFLGPDQPNLTAAPGTLDFGSGGNVAGGIDYTTLSPELKQVFFIGDGLTSQGIPQSITVPAGATRLFLGTMDGFGWFNNVGSFDVVVSSRTVATPPLTVVGQSAQSNTQSVAVLGNLAYVGTAHGINIVDVSSPSSPVILSNFGSSELPSGQDVTQLEVHNGNQLVVLTSNFGNSSLFIYSLADPNNPTLLGQMPFVYQGNVITAIGGFSISNNHLYTSSYWYRYHIFGNDIFEQFGESLDVDISNPAAPTIVSAIYNRAPDPAQNDNFPDGTSNVWQTAPINNNVLLAGTTTATRDVVTGVTGQVMVIDTTNPNAPTKLSTLDIPGMAAVTGIAIQGNHAILIGPSQYWGPGISGLQGNLVVTTLDITNPTAPTIISTRALNVSAHGISFLHSLGNNQFVTESVAGFGAPPQLVVLDVSDPSHVISNQFAIPAEVDVAGVTASGGYLYTADGSNLLIYSIGQFSNTSVHAVVTVPTNNGVSIVPNSFNLAPTNIIVGATSTTLEWDLDFNSGYSGQSLTWKSLVTNIQPGEQRTVATDAQVSFDTGSDTGTIGLPDQNVAGQQIIGLSPTASSGAPGAAVQYTVTLSNPYSNPVTYGLSVKGILPQWVNLPDAVTLNPNSNKTVQLTITSDALAALGDYGFSVNAQSFGTIFASVLGTLTLQGDPIQPDTQSHGIVAQLTPASATAGQGTSATYTVRLTNTGSAQDFFTLSVTGLPANIAAAFTQNGQAVSFLDVPPGVGNYRDVVLTLTPQTGAVVGTNSFQVVATALGTANVSSSVAGSLTVASRGVDVSLDHASVQPGGVFILTVKNTGSATDTFNLTLSGPAALVAQLASAQVTLAAGASKTVQIDIGQVNFAVPGSLSLTATAKSQNQAAILDSATGGVTIDPSLGVSAVFAPAAKQLDLPGSTTFQLNVNNTGNTDDLYTATIVGKSGPVNVSLVGLDGKPTQSISAFRLTALGAGTIVLQADLTALEPANVTVEIRSLSDNSIVAQTMARIIVPIPDNIGDILVLGSEGGPDVRSRVKVIDPTNDAIIATFSPYGDDFHGGVRVATADLDRDGELDIVTAPGPGIPGVIKVFDIHGVEKTAFRLKPYPNSFTGGVFVATGDVNGDGRLDIITTPGSGRAAEVKVFRNRDGLSDSDTKPFLKTPIADFYAFGTTFKGGATVAADDLTGDRKAEIIVGNGPGTSPKVRVFDVTKIPVTSTIKAGKVLREIHPFRTTDRGGVFVAAGLIKGTTSEIIVGNGVNGRGEVEMYRANGTLQLSFKPYADFPASANAPVHVSRKNYDGGRLTEILTAQGAGSSLTWRVFEHDASLVDEALESDADFKYGFFVA
jgi:uncharacterized membrane protein